MIKGQLAHHGQFIELTIACRSFKKCWIQKLQVFFMSNFSFLNKSQEYTSQQCRICKLFFHKHPWKKEVRNKRVFTGVPGSSREFSARIIPILIGTHRWRFSQTVSVFATFPLWWAVQCYRVPRTKQISKCGSWFAGKSPTPRRRTQKWPPALRWRQYSRAPPMYPPL